MTEHTILAPIELTDAELDAVSGGKGTSQSIRQSIEASLRGGTVPASGAHLVPVDVPLVAVAVQVGNNINVSPTIIV